MDTIHTAIRTSAICHPWACASNASSFRLVGPEDPASPKVPTPSPSSPAVESVRGFVSLWNFHSRFSHAIQDNTRHRRAANHRPQPTTWYYSSPSPISLTRYPPFLSNNFDDQTTKMHAPPHSPASIGHLSSRCRKGGTKRSTARLARSCAKNAVE